MNTTAQPAAEPVRGMVGPPTPPCANCGQDGYKRPDANRPERYRGERYGVQGRICDRCKRKFVQIETNRNRPPRHPGIRLEPPPTEETMAETMAEIRKEWAENGLISGIHDKATERQRRWAALASEARRETRQQRQTYHA